MHETEFYGTFRSISNASPKLVMEILSSRLFMPSRFAGERTLFETFARSDECNSVITAILSRINIIYFRTLYEIAMYIQSYETHENNGNNYRKLTTSLI